MEVKHFCYIFVLVEIWSNKLRFHVLMYPELRQTQGYRRSFYNITTPESQILYAEVECRSFVSVQSVLFRHISIQRDHKSLYRLDS